MIVKVIPLTQFDKYNNIPRFEFQAEIKGFLFATVMYRSIRNFNNSPGNPWPFDKTFFPGARNLMLESARGP